MDPTSTRQDAEGEAAGESCGQTLREGTMNNFTGRDTENKAMANPLMDGRRAEFEEECMKLCREEAVDSGRDPIDVMADASRFKGASKLNPSSMTDDRLIHTVLELRKARAWRKAQK